VAFGKQHAGEDPIENTVLSTPQTSKVTKKKKTRYGDWKLNSHWKQTTDLQGPGRSGIRNTYIVLLTTNKGYIWSQYSK
jgi:hypothetical protein